MHCILWLYRSRFGTLLWFFPGDRFGTSHGRISGDHCVYRADAGVYGKRIGIVPTHDMG